MSDRTVAIGCSSGFWGDSAHAAAQLVHSGKIDYLVSDYLAEITMSLLARARAKNPALGYPPDFVETLAPLVPAIAARGIRVVSNAGGVNPRACRQALAEAAAEAGVALRIAVIEGDDLMPRIDEIKTLAPAEMFTGARFPERLQSCNAYLGARAIATALDAGADIVLAGRCVDSAVTLGILMHEFGWRDTDYDLLAAGSLAGHVIECGPQCTGGLFTDWAEVPGWEDMGYPIVECSADGAFTVTKPAGTGGLVMPATVAEQIVYEIGDPAAYILPDVVCDFTNVKLVQDGSDRVQVSGARGRAPTPTYKVSATYADGWRVIATIMVAGRDAAAKARRMGEAIIERTRHLNQAAGRADYRETSVEVIGAEDTYGETGRFAASAREVVLKIGLRHDDKAALEVFSREMTQAGVAMAQGTTGLFGGRPSPSPVVRLFSFLLDKGRVPVQVELEGTATSVTIAAGQPLEPREPAAVADEPPPADAAEVPLIALAWGRSGDKGNDANIGVIARRPEFLPVLRRELTTQRVVAFFGHYVTGAVRRWELPGFHALNFLLTGALGGGGIASLRYDPQGKSYAQMLMDLPVRVPAVWLTAQGPLALYAAGDKPKNVENNGA
ncbi:acyclic terpene utilization AtuA family protein [Cupriavidus sp. IDO]|uniref:acyclic terpene utilization AtuA family protein n=1 Tax=Cupriavidus sp. IDO TaxID=1539142 RepID=UPI0005797FC5|nr:acyclic terpene utilization AtuA family protein [Cupriavidus sp. IDO]KWR87681.1 terpene utilization protein AtuA [Cupriavidus sp. IDO]